MTATHEVTESPARGSGIRERLAWTVAVLGLAVVVTAVVASALGWSVLIFRSGSMAPDIPAGAAAVARPVPVDEIAPGDVVSVVSSSGDRITHRVVDVVVGDDGVGRLTLRGDANGEPDAETYPAATVDRVVVSAPWVGYPVAFLLSPVGLVVLGCLALGFVVVAFGGDRNRDGGDGGGTSSPGPRRRRGARTATAVTAGTTALALAAGGVTGTLARFSDSATLVSGSYAANAYFTCAGAIAGATGGADLWWRFDEASTTNGSTVNDSSGRSTLRPGQYRGSINGGQSRACARDSGSAVTINDNAFMSTNTSVQAPGTFTASLWFKTTTTTGGKLFGFGNSQGDTSGTYDRHAYMTNNGEIVFGVYDGGTRTVTSPKTYRDNRWHQVTGTYSSAGVFLYIDGELVGSLLGSFTAEGNNGYWRVGNDNLNGWPSRPTSNTFLGTVDDFVVYTTPQSADATRAAYRAGLGS